MANESQIPGNQSSDQGNEFRLDEIQEVEKIFGDADTETTDIEEEEFDFEEPEKTTEDDNERISSVLIDKIAHGGNVQEALRDIIHTTVKSSYEDRETFTPQSTEPIQAGGFQAVENKRSELYEILDNIEGQLEGKSTQEVTAFFASLLNIQGQLCLQKTEGVISVRTRLSNFFPSLVKKGGNSMRQEITLIFSPEEVQAMRMRFTEMADEDPLKPFFTSMLDQAYDVVQYNEMTGHLLLEMSSYFIDKLEKSGYGNTTKTVEFKERHDRARLSLQKAISDLREIEAIINEHLADRPILVELPKFLRALIQVKLGLMPAKFAPQIIQKIQNSLGLYARARSAVAFDFNRLPSYQHGVRLRQSIILNLHKDILEYTGELFEKEFRSIQKELKQMMEEIESSSEVVDPGSPEYGDLMARKSIIQKRLETHRRKLDIVKSQEKLVNVQHRLCNDAIQRYNKQEALQKKVEEEVNNRSQIDPEKVRKLATPTEKKPPTSRMFMAKRRE
jgi:hypothetical protein